MTSEKALTITEPPLPGQPLVMKWDMGPKYQFSMEVSYLIDSEELEFKVNSMNKAWLALGFGESMFDVDMIAWHADGSNSYAQDYWSTMNDTPGVDDDVDLKTTFVEEADGRITFTTRRKLDTGDG